MTRFLILFFGLLFGFQAAAAELTVSAAASLANAFRELVPLYEAKHPNTKVQLNFAGSGALLQQIAKGAPVDVFASADQVTMDRAQEQDLIHADYRHDFVSNTLVVIVPVESQLAPSSLKEVATLDRIAIGLPASVPVGRYTKVVLEKAHLWKAIEPKMIGSQNVRQALDYVARAEVDAGFVYTTDAAIMPGKVKVAFTAPTESPIFYPIAPVRGGPNPDAAQSFVEFVQTDEAQAVLAKYGFGKP